MTDVAMILTFWRCAACGYQTGQKDRPTDHWRPRLDGRHSIICHGPFEQWEARKVA